MILVAILLVALFVMVEFFGIFAAILAAITNIVARQGTAVVNATPEEHVSVKDTPGHR